MFRKFWFPLILYGFILILTSGCFNSPQEEKIDLKEITLATRLDNSFVQTLLESYNQRETTKIKIHALTAEELNQGKSADIYLQEISVLSDLAQKNKLTPSLSEPGDLLSIEFKDHNNYWYGAFYDPVVFLVNQNYARTVGQENLRSWQDLIKLNRIRISMENLSDSVGTVNFLAAFASNRGEAKTITYFQTLHKNIPQYSKFPFTPIRLTTVGDADLAITRRSYVFKYLENDFPAYIVNPLEGTPIDLYGIGINAVSKNIKEAEQFRDWLLSDLQAQKLASEQNTGYIFLLQNHVIGNNKKKNALWQNTNYLDVEEQDKLIENWLDTVRFTSRSNN